MKETPILAQYKRIKAKYKDEILLFRIGDFYETFLEDAERTAKALGITLTSKPVGKGIRVPLAGIPVKAANTYIARLLKQGFKVAICEQKGEAQKGRKIMEREVVEVITPGTITLEELLEEGSSYYLAALVPDRKKERFTLALCDITTGEFSYFTDEKSVIMEYLKSLNVKEVVIPQRFAQEIILPQEIVKTVYEGIWYGVESAKEIIKEYFNIETPSTFGFKESFETEAAGLLLAYLKETKKSRLLNITGIRRVNLRNTLYIDAKTVRNLELIEKLFTGERYGTLLWAMDRCRTPMGKRLLKKLILMPSRDIEAINSRLKRVETFIHMPEQAVRVREFLRKIGDIERRLSRIVQRKANPIDVYLFGEELKAILEILKLLSEFEEFNISKELSGLSVIWQRIFKVLKPPSEQEKDYIKHGIDKELDELKDLLAHSEEKLAQFQERERKRTGIPTLKIGFNQVFGYYIEITKAHLDRVPEDYIRKQSLTSAERFITPELKEFEEKILTAQEKIEAIEKRIFEELVDFITGFQRSLKQLIEWISEVDLVLGFSEIAIERNYVKPELTHEDVLIIKDGRHPVVELIEKESEFVPNDTEFNNDVRVYIITGPNMAGKSTYLRQVALISIMAHIGSFVPASYVKIGIMDRIFSRIGASDDITRGISTFMAEMIETGEILHSATSSSLVVLDEVGRGTSTYDGMSIAFAVLKYLAKRRIKTLFATHYQEVSRLAEEFKQVRNFTMDIKEWNGRIYYLRKLKPGVCDRSYGIHVAKLAGLPQEVIEEAERILKELESQRDRTFKVSRKNKPYQLRLFDVLDEKERQVIEILKGIDPDELTPKQALDLIYRIKEEMNSA